MYSSKTSANAVVREQILPVLCSVIYDRVFVHKYRAPHAPSTQVDHSAYCPFELTHAEREDLCVSVQENVWGTDGLAKLKDIQDKLDPQKLFQCQKCVGGPI